MMTRPLLHALGLLAASLLAAPVLAQDGDYLPPPLLGPPSLNVYGPGVDADATGQPFHYETEDGEELTIEPPPEPDAYGLGVGMDVYGRRCGLGRSHETPRIRGHVSVTRSA